MFRTRRAGPMTNHEDAAVEILEMKKSVLVFFSFSPARVWSGMDAGGRALAGKDRRGRRDHGFGIGPSHPDRNGGEEAQGPGGPPLSGREEDRAGLRSGDPER